MLQEKFRLFEGVFGASDEVLGAIESGLDFERLVVTAVQECRNADEVRKAFAEIEEKLQDQIDADLKEARAKLFDTMDETVISRLQQRGQAIVESISDFEKRLIALAKAELRDAKFLDGDRRTFTHEGQVWTTRWPEAEEKGWQFFRLSEGTLADDIATRARARSFGHAPVQLTIEASAYPFDGQVVECSG